VSDDRRWFPHDARPAVTGLAEVAEVAAVAEVEAVIDSLLIAFEAGHVQERALAVFDDVRPEAVTLVLPGLRPIRGREAAVRALTAVAAANQAVQFLLSDRLVSIDGDTAVVNLVMDVLVTRHAGDAAPGAAVSLTRSFVLRRRAGGWRIVLDAAGPVMRDDESVHGTALW
jgi:ketosteroid isomerase-like protein